MTDSSTAPVERQWEPYRPSNGTEGDIFRERYCDRCLKDEHGDCGILVRTLAFDIGDTKYPVEWRRPKDDESWPGRAECTAFETMDKLP